MRYVDASLVSGYQVKNSTRGFNWLADEPEEKGGANTGPRPSELMLSALASCKIITCKMYAERKGWDLWNVDIRLSIPEDQKNVIEKRIRFDGDLTDEMRERLLVISGRCPVVKMIDPAIEFKIVE